MASKKHKSRVRRGIKSGMAPGTPVFIGERKRDDTRIHIMDFNEANLSELTDVGVEACAHLSQAPSVTWINISGVHDMTVIEALGRHFNLHSLTLEAIVNTTQRPKVEESPG